MNGPAVSVLMPVHNARRYVADAIDSVLRQTLRDFELIIVDDGSGDGSDQILRAAAARDRRITLITQANAGISAALNRAAAHACGEFLARMDADDLCRPDRFERQVRFLQQHADHVAVGSAALMIDADGLPLKTCSVPLLPEEIAHRLFHSLDWVLIHPTLMMRRQVFHDIGGYQSRFDGLEDLDLFIRLTERGRVANLPEPLLEYRQHSGSACFTRGVQHQALRRAILREALQRRGLDESHMPAEVPLPKTPFDVGDFERMWAWWALDSGFVKTARRYARRSLLKRPLRRESWILLLCSLRGY